MAVDTPVVLKIPTSKLSIKTKCDFFVVGTLGVGKHLNQFNFRYF